MNTFCVISSTVLIAMLSVPASAKTDMTMPVSPLAENRPIPSQTDPRP